MRKPIHESHRLPTFRWSVISRRKISPRVILLALLFTITVPLLYAWLPAGDDWASCFRPAALNLLRGDSPYSVAGYYNAPWALLPLIPIALLPFQWGRVVFFLVSLAGFAYIVRRLTTHPLSVLLFLTSAPVVYCFYGGNLDWIAMLSYILPAPFALIFAAIKPQIGAGILIYWLVESWRQGGARLVIRNFFPVALLFMSSLIFYGLWPSNFSELDEVPWNVSLFPYLIPVGIFLLGWAITKREPRPAMSAGLFFSPYFSLRSIFPLLVPLLERPNLLRVVWLIMWLGAIGRILFQ